MILELVSPERILFKGNVVAVNVPGTLGAFEILDDHAPIVSTLKKGAIKITGQIDSESFYKKDNKFLLDIEGGVVEVQKNKVVILVD